MAPNISNFLQRKSKEFKQNPMKFFASFIPKLQRYVVSEVRRHAPLLSLKPIDGIRIEQVTTENVASISHFRSQEVVESFRRYLAQGDLGIYAFYGDRAVGHAWAALPDGTRRLIWGHMPVTSDTVSFLFFSVDPQFRGRKIFQLMLVELVKLVFSTTNVSRVLADVPVYNAPSLAGVERAGFRRLCILPVLRWRGHTIRLARIPKAEPDRP